ncbi:MAG TPA: nucleotide exchange factor GrpE [Anaerolineae bacterium]|nr:nucleotide exchange factor GrpE [Anaerolineae bacterium]
MNPIHLDAPRRPGLLSRLRRRLGFTPIPADVSEELAALRAEVSALARAQHAQGERAAALRETIDKLDKQIARAGKEQFKANSLLEAQQQTVKSLLDQLREANAYRERELAQLRDRLAGVRAEGRMEIVTRLLPALDGLDEALNAGRRLHAGDRAAARPTFRVRARHAWAVLIGQAPADAPAPDEALVAWLDGLDFVRDRLLGILASEGVQPIEAAGELFDPALHVAVETAPAGNGVAPGAIVRELRRGYRARDAVLRYAEVVVAR